VRKGYVTARIFWLTPEEGGRLHPVSSRYAATAMFEGYDNHWSFFITDYNAPDPVTHTHYVQMTLMLREMINELLTPGRSFKIFEGSRLVGTGEVIV
jgi:translation elongation factor EF-Tu-like GTPase